MSPATSSAIVITYPGHHLRRAGMTGPHQTRHGDMSACESLDLDNDFRNSGPGGGGGTTRKRRRLTHLSPDEKLLRRKLKNRVAAQTARDRKKAQMVELEEKLAILEKENELLKLQNFSLKEASSRLAKENAVLMCQLADQQLVTTVTDSETKRSAAPCVPLLKEQVQNLPRYVTQYIIMPDNFLGLLQELVEESKCEWPQIQMATSLPQVAPSHGSSTPRMVGMTSSELETLNELISIDHVYVKPQPQHQHTGKDGHHKATTTVRDEDTNCSISLLKNYRVGMSESKIGHPGHHKATTTVRDEDTNCSISLLKNYRVGMSESKILHPGHHKATTAVCDKDTNCSISPLKNYMVGVSESKIALHKATTAVCDKDTNCSISPLKNYMVGVSESKIALHKATTAVCDKDTNCSISPLKNYMVGMSESKIGHHKATTTVMDENTNCSISLIKNYRTGMSESKIGHHKATTTVCEEDTNCSISPLKNYRVGMSESNIGHPGELICGSYSPNQHRTPSFTQDVKLNSDNSGFTSSPYALSSSPCQDIANNFMSLLSCPDVEAMTFSQNGDYCEHDQYTEARHSSRDGAISVPSGLNNHRDGAISVPPGLNHHRDGAISVPPGLNQTAQVSENEQIATDLFHEIYEHYLNMKDSCCSDSIAESDSGVCNDFDAVSPENSGEPLHDLMWHETSFADLFPDLH